LSNRVNFDFLAKSGQPQKNIFGQSGRNGLYEQLEKKKKEKKRKEMSRLYL